MNVHCYRCSPQDREMNQKEMKDKEITHIPIEQAEIKQVENEQVENEQKESEQELSCLLPENHYPVVCFDLDGTLIDGTVFIWETLHDYFKTDMEKRNRAREDFFSGRIPYRAWFETDLELLSARGADRERISIMLKEKMRPMIGAHETLSVLRGEGVKTAILSGSLDVVLSAFYEPEMFDVVFLNKVRFDEIGLLSGGDATLYDLEKKGEGLLEIAARLGVCPSECAFVGDNYNDLSAVAVAGRSIAFCPKSSDLRERADVTIDRRDLRAILPHLAM